jgi:hypothetical protein
MALISEGLNGDEKKGPGNPGPQYEEEIKSGAAPTG